jgi:predicted TPR repeat methyltransferase
MLNIAALCTTHVGCGVAQPPEEGAEERPLYDGLRALDLETMTLTQAHGEGAAFGLIIAADVLVYFGKLGPVLLNFARLSAQGAPLIFSCERATLDEAPEGWKLLPSGRFAHTKEYVFAQATAAGYEAIDYVEMTPRYENGEAVRGHLFTLELRGMPEGGLKSEL